MSVIKGIGPCAIPGDDGLPCARQVAEGEAIGTVVAGLGPTQQAVTGHKKCADSYHYRVQQSEKEKRSSMVKRIDQSGPGGFVDPRTAKDAVMGDSVPLDLSPTSVQDHAALSNFIGNVPEDATPEEAYRQATRGTVPLHSNGPIRVNLQEGYNAPVNKGDDHLTPEEQQELDAFRDRLLAVRGPKEPKVQTLKINGAVVLPGTEILRIEIEL